GPVLHRIPAGHKIVQGNPAERPIDVLQRDIAIWRERQRLKRRARLLYHGVGPSIAAHSRLPIRKVLPEVRNPPPTVPRSPAHHGAHSSSQAEATAPRIASVANADCHPDAPGTLRAPGMPDPPDRKAYRYRRSHG